MLTLADDFFSAVPADCLVDCWSAAELAAQRADRAERVAFSAATAAAWEAWIVRGPERAAALDADAAERALASLAVAVHAQPPVVPDLELQLLREEEAAADAREFAAIERHEQAERRREELAAAAEPDPVLPLPRVAAHLERVEQVVREQEPGARVVGFEIEQRAASGGGQWQHPARVWVKPVLWYAGERRTEVAGRRFEAAWLFCGRVDARYSGPASATGRAHELARGWQYRLHQMLGAE